MDYSKYSVKSLRDIIRQYNLHTHIVGFSRMGKADLISSIKKFLNFIDNEFIPKSPKFSIKKPEEMKLRKPPTRKKKEVTKPEPENLQLQLKKISDLIDENDNQREQYEDEVIQLEEELKYLQSKEGRDENSHLSKKELKREIERLEKEIDEIERLIYDVDEKDNLYSKKKNEIKKQIKKPK